jgi:hypothetical protein
MALPVCDEKMTAPLEGFSRPDHFNDASTYSFKLTEDFF